MPLAPFGLPSLPPRQVSEEIVNRSSIRSSSPSSAASIQGSIPTDSLLDPNSHSRRRLKRGSLNVFVHESGTEAHRGNDTRKGSRKSALSPDARERARKIRSIGACWGCRVMKKTLYMRAALHQESLTSMARDFLKNIGNLRGVGHEVVQETLRLLNMTSGENFNRSLRDVLNSFEYLRSKSHSASRLFIVCLLSILSRYWFNNDLVRLVYNNYPKVSLCLEDCINKMHAVMDILMLLVQGEPRYYLIMIRGVADGAIDRMDRLPMLDMLDVHSKTSTHKPVRDVFFTYPLDFPPMQSTRKQRRSSPPDTVMSDPDNRASMTDPQFNGSSISPPPGEQRKYVCMLYGPWLIDYEDRPYCSFCGMYDASDEHLEQAHRALECFMRPADERTWPREEDLAMHMRFFHDANVDSLVTMTEREGLVKVDTMLGVPWARGRWGARKEEEGGTREEGD
ncbi:MAG: hypothetical protein Q9167_004786 [Letrouitia subvulpina]